MARMTAKSLTSFRTCRWRGLGQAGRAGGCTQSHPHTSGTGAMSLGWLRDAHPHREVAAAPEALEGDAEEEGAPEEEEGDEGDIGHVLAAGPQEMPTLIQALGPAQPCWGGRRLQGKVGGEEGSHMDTLGSARGLSCLPGSRGCTCQVRGEGSDVSFPAEL